MKINKTSHRQTSATTNPAPGAQSRPDLRIAIRGDELTILRPGGEPRRASLGRLFEQAAGGKLPGFVIERLPGFDQPGTCDWLCFKSPNDLLPAIRKGKDGVFTLWGTPDMQAAFVRHYDEALAQLQPRAARARPERPATETGPALDDL
jgi:hypothetical protein